MINLFLFLSIYTSKGNFDFYLFPYVVYRGKGVFTIEIWYSFNVKNTALKKKGGVEEASFDIEVKWKEISKGKQKSERWTKKFKIGGHSGETKIYDVFSINLEKGNYEIAVIFETKSRSGEVKFNKNLNSDFPFISDIFISPSMGKEEKYFFKRQNIGFEIKFPFEFVYPDTVFYYYYELYGFKGNESVIYEIIKNNKVIYSQEEKAPEVKSGFTYGRIPIYKFGSGDFVFKVKIIRNEQLLFEREEKVKYISQKELQEMRVHQFYEKYLFFIDYFALPSELSEFRKLKNFEAKKMFVQKFWKRFDPDPQTPVNEFIYELIERIKFADQNFSLGLKRLGRYTDRGRIYIKYGKPAEVENSYYPEAERAWESWIYNEPRRMQFIFSDINQDGNYILIYSSIPEEQPSRADWEKWVPQEAIQVRQ